MPFIEALFNQAAFDEKTTKAMDIAYDTLAAEMGLTRVDDPINRRLAEAIIEVAGTGQSDPEKICTGVIALIMKAKP